MNSLVTLRTTLILFLIIFCGLTAKAQNPTPPKDTTKVILVVTPGQNYNQPANTASPAPVTPVKTNSTQYYAPTTAERVGTPTYMDPNYKKPVRSSAAGAVVPAGSGSSSTVTTTSGNAGTPTLGGSSTTSNTVTTTKTTTTIDPHGKKTISQVKVDTVYIKKTDTIIIKQPVDKKLRGTQILFGELGGPGLSLSLNYDQRFSGAQRGGLGFRIGAGYYGTGGNTVFSIPFQVNYLIGQTNNFIELGGGTTFLNSTGDNTGKTFIFDRVTGLIGTATIGYRYQPIDKKLNFRLDFVPIFYDEGIIWAGGVSIGYNF